MWLLLTLLASGADLDVTALTVLPVTQTDVPIGAGASLRLRTDWESPFDLGVAVGAGATPDNVLFWLRPELRVALDADDALSVVAGGGLWAEGALAAHGAVGLDFDIPSKTRTGLRFHTRYLVSSGDPTFRVELGVGMRIGPRPEAPVVEPTPPEPEPVVVEPEPEPVLTQVPNFPVNSALVWVPSPVCSWLPPGQANDAMLEMPTLPSSMAAVGVFGPAAGASGSADGSSGSVTIEPPPPPTLGDVVFALNPGDVVEIDGERIDATDGVVMVRREDGEAQVRIVGGGRIIETPIGVSAGRSIWLSVPAAEPLRVTFPSGSSRLSAEGRERVEAIAAAAGESRFSIEGSFSAGGSEQLNRRLAAERSQAVLDVLFANGLDASRVEILPPQPPDDGLTPAEQRAAVLRVLGDDS